MVKSNMEQDILKILMSEEQLHARVQEMGNELYDRFADTVLLGNGDRPAVIEDYLDELKGLVLT